MANTIDSNTIAQLHSNYLASQPKAQPQSSSGLGGFLARAGKSIISAPEYFAKAAIVNPIKETAAQVTGNTQALKNATQQSNQDLGLGASGNNIGQGLKTLAGNTAQVAALAIPAAKAGTLGKVAQGAKIGAVSGGGSALANNQNVVSGALEGAATGGLAGGILGKFAGKGTETAATKPGGFAKNLVTQGQQAQGRVAGVSAGSKIAGKELTPQDTTQMLETLKSEGINTGNANNTLRDVVDRQKVYGQEIGNYFKTNDAPLHPTDTKQIADNFIKGIGTTDPGVVKQAQILAQDLQKNVTSTKSLWEFRKSLDSRIPDSKMAAGDNVLSNKLAAIKSLRGYISKELGEVPGMSGYHSLAEVKPFVSAEARRLNNPGGGIVGRVAASGPVQKLESSGGKVTEKLGKALGGEAPAVAPEAAAPTTSGFLGNLVGGVKSAAPVIGAVGAGGAEGNKPIQPATDLPPVDTTLTDQTSPTDQTNSEQSATPSISPEQLLALVQADPKNASTYLSLYSALKPSAASTKLNASQQQQANNAQSALSNIADIRAMLSENPSLATKSGIPGQGSIIGGLESNVLGTGKYNAALNNLTDVIGRLRSGAALSAAEEARYKALAPKAGDSASTINYKLDNLEQLLGKFAAPASTNGADIQQLLSNAGG